MSKFAAYMENDKVLHVYTSQEGTEMRDSILTVSRRVVAVQDQFQYEVNPCRICDGQIVRRLPPRFSASPVTIVSPVLYSRLP
jgi:hypothetical protein